MENQTKCVLAIYILVWLASFGIYMQMKKDIEIKLKKKVKKYILNESWPTEQDFLLKTDGRKMLIFRVDYRCK